MGHKTLVSSLNAYICPPLRIKEGIYTFQRTIKDCLIWLFDCLYLLHRQLYKTALSPIFEMRLWVCINRWTCPFKCLTLSIQCYYRFYRCGLTRGYFPSPSNLISSIITLLSSSRARVTTIVLHCMLHMYALILNCYSVCDHHRSYESSGSRLFSSVFPTVYSAFFASYS